MPQDTRPVPPQPLDVLWHPNTLIWIIMTGEALAMALSLAPGVEADRLILFGLNSLAIQWTALICLSLLYCCRRLLQGYTTTTIAVSALGTLLLGTLSTYLLLRLLISDTTPPPQGGWLQLLFHMIALALIFGLLGVAAFQNHWRNRMLAIHAKQAELDTLRARVAPHFLFNALNSAVALVRQQPAASERLLMDLADLFRAALSQSGTVSLEHEIQLSRQYLEIEILRFGERLKLNWKVPPLLPSLEVPSLSLQPLMENAIRHGIEVNPQGGILSVDVEVLEEWVCIRVSNPITPLPSITTKGHQLGLKSIQSRLDTHFRGHAVVESTTANNIYQTLVKLPLS